MKVSDYKGTILYQPIFSSKKMTIPRDKYQSLVRHSVTHQYIYSFWQEVLEKHQDTSHLLPERHQKPWSLPSWKWRKHMCLGLANNTSIKSHAWMSASPRPFQFMAGRKRQIQIWATLQLLWDHFFFGWWGVISNLDLNWLLNTDPNLGVKPVWSGPGQKLILPIPEG